jgi:hypothetical protein
MAYPGSPLYRTAIERSWELPDSWSGFSQHSYDCLPLPTEKVTATDVLRFRDDAFHEYFSNSRYLELVTKKFGKETRRHVEQMCDVRLPRKILQHAPVAMC